MRRKGWGRIVSTASAHSLTASPGKSAYVMAKHGLVGLTKTIALETATDGITVNAISPGYVWTPLVEKQIPDTMRTRGLTREQVVNDPPARRPADQAVRDRRAGGGAGGVPVPRRGGVDYRRQSVHGRRLDRGMRRIALLLALVLAWAPAEAAAPTNWRQLVAIKDGKRARTLARRLDDRVARSACRRCGCGDRR